MWYGDHSRARTIRRGFCRVERAQSIRSVARSILIFFGAALLLPDLGAQVVSPEQTIFFDALPFAGEGWEEEDGVEGRIDLYVAVPYAPLDFRRSDGEFVARYRLRLILEGDLGLLLDTIWVRDVRTASVERTNGVEPAFDFYQERIPVPAGSYTARFELLDYGTNLTVEDTRNLSVIPFRRYRFSLSGLMLVGSVRATGDRHTIIPLLSDNVSSVENGYFLFFEVYNRRDFDSVDFTALYRNEAGEVVWQEEFRRALEEKEGSRGRLQEWLRLPNDGFPRGDYTVDLIASRTDREDDTLALARRKVSIDGPADGMPMTEEEMRERVERLRYVATQSEIDRIREGVTFEEIRDRYGEFWKERDPTPGTARNEAMEEYFRRVEYADAEFRSYAEGWLTDMGRIYIVFGPPDRIDRDPFGADGRARVTWVYYRRGGSIIFADQTGFDDFRLVTPISLSEKFRY